VVGVFVPEDPKGPDTLSKKGAMAFDFGLFWSKGQRIGTGQTSVKKYNRFLCDLIASGRAKPSFIVSHELCSRKPRKPTSTSTRVKTAGRRSC
jgi:glutathione-independent formaldehyde dehydrogenase